MNKERNKGQGQVIDWILLLRKLGDIVLSENGAGKTQTSSDALKEPRKDRNTILYKETFWQNRIPPGKKAVGGDTGRIVK